MKTLYKELYFAHFPRVMRVAYYIIKDRAKAEDIAQEVFLKLWDKRSDLRDILNVEAYLVQMAKNMALTHLENVKRETNFQLELRSKMVELDGDRNSEEERITRVQIEKAVSALSPQCRLIFSLSRFEGLSNDEISDYLGISKRTVETQISNAFKRFRTDLRHLFSNILPSFFLIISTIIC